MVSEIWKEIEGYENRYSVSNLGRVRSNAREITCCWRGKETTFHKKSKILKGGMGGDYRYVALCKDGKDKHVMIHILVAKAFVPNPCPDQFDVVNHKDCNPLNNSADNLEWCTTSYNIKYAYRFGRLKTPNPGHPVRCIELDITFPSQTSAGQYFGVTQATIRNAIVDNKPFRGFHFIEI